jgi:hypothetical protein
MRRKLCYISITGVLILTVQISAFAGLRVAWNFEDGTGSTIAADVSGVAPAMNATGQGTYSIVWDVNANHNAGSWVLDPTAGNYDSNGNPLASGGFLANSQLKTQGNWNACTLSLWVRPKASQNGSVNWAVNDYWKLLTGRTNGSGPRTFTTNSGFLFASDLTNSGWEPVAIWRSSAWDPCDVSWDETGPWHHLLVTFDSDVIGLWIDGVKHVTHDTNSVNIAKNKGSWGICWNTAAGSNWMVDDVAWFKGYIDDANVVELYNGTKNIYTVTVKDANLPMTPPPADKLAYSYRMDEAVNSSILADYSANAGPRIRLVDGSGTPNPCIIDDPDRFRVLQMNYATGYRGDDARIKQTSNNFFMNNRKATFTWWANTIKGSLGGGWLVSQGGNGIRMDRWQDGIRAWITIQAETWGSSVVDLKPENGLEGYGVIEDNEWHFFAVTFDSNCPQKTDTHPGYLRDDPCSWRIPYGSTDSNDIQRAVAKLYVDGIQVAKDNTPHCGLLVGGETDVQLLKGLTGMIDDLRKYNEALTIEQIRYLYHKTRHADDGIFVDTSYCEAPNNDPNKPGVVTVDEDIRWNPGKSAANHEIWFGTEGAMANVGTQSRTNCSYDPAGDLLLDTVYEWKVNESNGVSAWPASGSWKFKTVNYLMLEDFESYTSDTTLRAVWKVSATSCSGNPVLVDDPLSEGRVYHGAQAIKMSSIDLSVSPYRAMYYKTLSTAVNLSTANQNVKALRIAYKGDVANKETKICAYLKDSSNRIAVIEHPESYSSVALNWTEWNIVLSEFTAVNPSLNLASIIEYGVGVGTGAAGASGVGSMWFDDIRLFQPRCTSVANKADVNGDCKVDYDDLKILHNDWLDDGSIAGGGKLVALWRFEDGAGSKTADESSGHLPSADGVVKSTVFTTAIIATIPAEDPNRGGSLFKCNSYVDNYVDCDVDSGTNKDKFNFGGGATLSAWIKPTGSASSGDDQFIITSEQGPRFYQSVTNLKFAISVNPEDSDNSTISTTTNPLQINKWSHIAGVYNPNDVSGPTLIIYFNGNKIAEKRCSPNVAAELVTAYNIGNRTGKGVMGFIGKIDDVAIYNRALTLTEVRSIKNATTISGFQLPTVDPLYSPIASPANVYKEAFGTDKVNFRDYSIISDRWLENPSLWP